MSFDTVTVETFTARIYVGLKERSSGLLTPLQDVRSLLQSYVDKVGFCITLDQTEFIYKEGNEPGVVVGIINYPRFPETDASLVQKAVDIAESLLDLCRQLKVSVVMPEYTVMLSREPSKPKEESGEITA